MMSQNRIQFWKTYSNIVLLLTGMVVGGFFGVLFPASVNWLKPVGDIFLNLLFVTVVPLVFFAITTAVAGIEQRNRLGKILVAMVFTFLCFILLAALFTTLAVYLFPITQPVAENRNLVDAPMSDDLGWGERMVSFFTVSEFYQLLSRQHMLALLLFSFLLGTAVRSSGPAAKPMHDFLTAGNEVMKKLLLLIMRLAPVGLGAYVAYQAATLGPQLFGFYAKPMALYYSTAAIYFLLFFSLYAFIANGTGGVKRFWKNNIVPSVTAISTCSSLATMPANLLAAEKIGIPGSVANVVIPLGTTIHKNGSSISSIVKTYVAFQLLGWNFFEPANLVTALGITILVSMVAGGIPNGGYIGEMLMISAYKLPGEAIPSVMIIGTLVDPLATILNATGNTVAAMVVTRLTGEKFTPEIKTG